MIAKKDPLSKKQGLAMGSLKKPHTRIIFFKQREMVKFFFSFNI